MAERLEDWPKRLADFLSRDFVFNWDGAHCGIYVAAAIEAQTGINPTPVWAKECVSKGRLYAEYRRRYGGGALEAARGFAKEFGLMEIPLGFAGRGAIAYIGTNDGVLGVVDLSGEFVSALTLTGKTRVPLSACLTAWRV